MKTYRTYGAGFVRQSMSLSPATVEGLERIRLAFASKYPEGKYPTLSSVLESLLEAHLEQLEADPEQLEAEVRDFESRYLHRPS